MYDYSLIQDYMCDNVVHVKLAYFLAFLAGFAGVSCARLSAPRVFFATGVGFFPDVGSSFAAGAFFVAGVFALATFFSALTSSTASFFAGVFVFFVLVVPAAALVFGVFGA